MVLGSPQNVKEISTRCNFLGVKTDNLTNFMCPLSRNPGIINLLKPSGSVKCCNVIALLMKSSMIRVINRVVK